MEIIAFHDCDSLMTAKKYEQVYFEQYKATLNSIEPMPKPKIKPNRIFGPKPIFIITKIFFTLTIIDKLENY